MPTQNKEKEKDKVNKEEKLEFKEIKPDFTPPKFCKIEKGYVFDNEISKFVFGVIEDISFVTQVPLYKVKTENKTFWTNRILNRIP